MPVSWKGIVSSMQVKLTKDDSPKIIVESGIRRERVCERVAPIAFVDVVSRHAVLLVQQLAG